MKDRKELTIVCFEAGDGVGKTTIAKAITNILKAKGTKAKYYREPGGNKEAEKIRNLIFELGQDIDKTTQLLLFFAARNELLQNDIANEDEDTIIILDRFFMSSMVYQQSIDKTLKLFKLIYPDYGIRLITLYLTIDKEIIEKRLKAKAINDSEFNSYDALDSYKISDAYEKIYQLSLMTPHVYPAPITKVEITENLQDNVQSIYDILWDLGINNKEYIEWLADSLIEEHQKPYVGTDKIIPPYYSREKLISMGCSALEQLWDKPIPERFGKIPLVEEHEYKED